MRDINREKLRSNLASVQARITAACYRAGRSRSDVTLVAVTKYVDVATARALVELGVTDLGESRPQELWRKAAAIPEARWHLVGHLQRNKIAETLPFVHMVHSVDSYRLVEAIEQESKKQSRFVHVLLEFNLSGEQSKHGFATTDIALLLPTLRECKDTRIAGLMTMAAADAPAGRLRATFRGLRELRDRLAEELNSPALGSQCWMHAVSHLSMGMTNDFEIAIEEGATLVRIGSALFEGLETRAT